MKIKSNDVLLLFSIFVLGTILRFYNHSFDNLWYDEVISFWISDPKLSLKESFANHNLVEVSTFTYHFLLKYYYQLFGYSVEAGRILSVSFGSLSILSVAYLNWQLTKNRSYLFAAFLISLNIFLISFSQEMRLYSILFFFSSLSLIFFLKILDKNKISFFIFFLLSTILIIFLHPFALILVFSYFFYLVYLFIKTQNFQLKLTSSIFLILIISFFVYFYSFAEISAEERAEYFWMTNPNLKFYTNFYFSSFFGSRIMGIFFLVTFFYLMFFYFRKIKNLDFIKLFLIIIFLSYALPLAFGYVFKPIMVNRYIIFILIPIISFISITTFELSKNKKIFIVIFLSLITFGNHFTEQSFKQFIKERVVSKPEYLKATKYISDSNIQDYILKVKKMKSKNGTTNAIEHYINYIGSKNNFDLKLANLEEKNFEYLWHLCLQDFNGKNCDIDNLNKDFVIIEKKYFNNIELKLIKFD